MSVSAAQGQGDRTTHVDDQRHLLDVDTTGEQATRRARAELLHDHLALALVHVTVHGRDGELALVELLCEPVDLAAGRAEDDGLGDGDRLVEIAEGVKFPILLVDGDVWKNIS